MLTIWHYSAEVYFIAEYVKIIYVLRPTAQKIIGIFKLCWSLLKVFSPSFWVPYKIRNQQVMIKILPLNNNNSLLLKNRVCLEPLHQVCCNYSIWLLVECYRSQYNYRVRFAMVQRNIWRSNHRKKVTLTVHFHLDI